jgi:hypothetical protein
LHERDGVLVGAQRVGVRDPARQHERVEVLGGDVGDGLVDLLGVGLVEVVEHLDLARPGTDEDGLVAGVREGLPRLGELDLLDPLMGDEECDGLGHGSPWWVGTGRALML